MNPKKPRNQCLACGKECKIYGDVATNRPENLRLLCPNCHALTDTFGALNRGKGKRPNHKGGYLTPSNKELK